MSRALDAIILGLGAMGSAAAYEMAKRGMRVLGLDRFAPPHALGSTHGETRIIREAYFEDPAYVPLVQRAYELWSDAERESGRTLLRITGGLMIGAEDSELVSGALRSAREHTLPHEMLSARETRRRFPACEAPDDMVALLEPRAGILFPEACVETFLALAERRGAELHVNERALAWESGGSSVRVRTERAEYEADQLVIAAGPWLPGLLAEHGASVAERLQVERQIIHWYEPAHHAEWFAPDALPITLWESSPSRWFYSFPDLGDGIKFGIHHEGELVDPDHVRRTVRDDDIEPMNALVRRFMPAAFGRLRESRVCLYTDTPDHHFLIDRLPDEPRVLVVSPCSGHGFKFASAIGEVAAELIARGESRFDLRLFRMARV